MSCFGNSKVAEAQPTPIAVFDLLKKEDDDWAMYQEGIQLMHQYKTNSSWSVENYNKIVKKCQDIMTANPWLMSNLEYVNKATGKVISKDDFCGNLQANFGMVERSLKLYLYNKKKTDVGSKFVKEDIVDAKLFDQSTPYSQKCDILRAHSTKIKTAGEIYADETGKEKLSGFSVLRDNEDISLCKNVAVVFSIQHLIGDGCTMYALSNMIATDAEVKALNRNPLEHLDEINKFTCLSNESGGDIVKDMGGPGLMVPYLMKSISRQGKEKYKAKMFNFKVNEEEVQRYKDLYNKDDKFVSTNDILTSWLFKKNEKANFIQLAVDLRGRCPSLTHDLAGNYLNLILLDNKDIQTPMGIREKINLRLSGPSKFETFPNSKDTTIHQALPGYKEVRKYCGGISSNWTRFYKSMRIDGLDHVFSCPFHDDQDLVVKMMGIEFTMEDNIIIFKCNDDEYGCYVFTASSRITGEDLKSDPMVGESIM